MDWTEISLLVARLGLDVACVAVLLTMLSRRRTYSADMTLVLTALNIGLFAAVSVIGTGDFPTGVGFGLFGLLSLVRLRSTAFTLSDMGYTFIVLVLALVNGLPERSLIPVLILDAVLLASLWIVDLPRPASPKRRTVRLTVPIATADPEELNAEVARLLPGRPLSVSVEEVDWVKKSTRLTARYLANEIYGAASYGADIYGVDSVWAEEPTDSPADGEPADRESMTDPAAGAAR